MNKYLKNYYNAVQELTKEFCKKYFKGVYEYNVSDWAGGEIGGIICINDYYFDFKNIEIAIKYKATKKELFDYYDESYEKYIAGEDCINFEHYLKYYRGFSFKEIDKKLKK
jgi:hypothetical protein